MESKGLTNGCVEIEALEFFWKSDSKEWTDSQLQVIQQGDLFATKEQMHEIADRVPWQFRLKYREKNTGREDDGKVLAWSYTRDFAACGAKTKDDNAALEQIAERVRGSIFQSRKNCLRHFGDAQ